MATAESLREPQASAEPSAPRRRRVVDDDRALRSSLERVLAQNGYAVVAAENAQQARGQLEAASFAVVVLGLVLPDAEGLELLREIKATQPETEVLVVTAYGSIESAVEAMRWGAYDYLTKPFHTAELLATLGDAGGKEAGGAGGAEFAPGDRRRRERHGQGAGGRGPAPGQQPRRQAAHQAELRRPARNPAGGGAVRLRARGLHRRRQPQAGPG